LIQELILNIKMGLGHSSHPRKFISAHSAPD
jgi:hypothetical protein